jgi:AraC family transcriptional regulator of adaptative response/methylated-DNA-[protein]-cysteine methyltransferase
MQAQLSRTEMETAFYRKEGSYDGLFYVGVTTTGIFCRPSCSARKPLPENVEFFSTAKEALGSGYRPCKRCRPLETDGRPPEWVEAVLAKVEAEPAVRLKDRELREMGVEPSRLRRYFRETFGMTFQAYARSRRLGDALDAIRRGRPLDHVALDHGFESHSGFRDAFARIFGDSPGRSRLADCVRLAWLESPLGPLVAGADDRGVCLLEFADRRMLEAQFLTLRRRLGCALLPGTHRHLESLREELSAYFERRLQAFGVPLFFPGTPFQNRVWAALLKIPYGETRSYAEIAGLAGAAGASRAAGRANGLNRIAILLPCHRVVGADGALTGYGGGLHRKRLLLDLEQGRPVPWLAP